MQSTDERDRVVDTRIIQNEDNLPRLEEVMQGIQESRAKGAVKHVIANMPAKGETVEINGLKFIVKASNAERGTLHLKIITP